MKKFFGFVVGVFGLFLMPAAVQAAIDDGLIAHYEFEGNALDSVRGELGQEEGTINYIDGNEGLQAEFAGSSHISANPVIDKDTSFTVSARVNAYAVSGSGAAMILMERDVNGNDVCGPYSFGNYELDIYQGKFAFAASTIDENGSCIAKRIFSSETVQPNTTYLVTGLFDAANHVMKLYVNGELVAEDYNIGSVLRNNANEVLRIGRNHPRIAKPQFWNGTIDDVRIYDRALSDSEIGELAAMKQEPTCTEGDLNCGLVAHYPLDGNAQDASGNGNHGTANGGLTYGDGAVDQAASFDGNTVMSAGDPFPSGTTENDPITVGLWLKTTTTKSAAGVANQ